MDLDEIRKLTLPVIVIACLIVGYILKSYVPLRNRHIPLLMTILGIALNYLINGYISFAETIIAGALSGLISTGLNQMFAKYINRPNDRNNDKDE